MDFLFLGLTLGCAIFLFRIISEYLNETPVWQNKIERADSERVKFEAQVETLMAAKNDSAALAKKMDAEIKSLEQMRDELKAQIEATKKEMARQGKIIMKRQTE